MMLLSNHDDTMTVGPLPKRKECLESLGLTRIEIETMGSKRKGIKELKNLEFGVNYDNGAIIWQTNQDTLMEHQRNRES